MTRILWMLLGSSAVAFGVIGIFLPLLPTTPFLLFAAFAFGKSSQRLHTWLVTHPRLGPPILDWRAHGAISRRVKVYALVSMLAAFLLAWIFAAPIWALGLQLAVLSLVALFIVSRPETKFVSGEELTHEVCTSTVEIDQDEAKQQPETD